MAHFINAQPVWGLRWYNSISGHCPSSSSLTLPIPLPVHLPLVAKSSSGCAHEPLRTTEGQVGESKTKLGPSDQFLVPILGRHCISIFDIGSLPGGIRRSSRNTSSGKKILTGSNEQATDIAQPLPEPLAGIRPRSCSRSSS